MKLKLKKDIRIIFFIILYLLLIYIFLIFSSKNGWFWPEKEFKQSQWINSRVDKDRHFFAKDLIEKKILLGLTKNKVLYVLGEPDEKTELIYRYKLTHYDSLFLHYLEVKFNELNFVESAQISPYFL